jgi:Flp pilus assembly protein TadD
VVSFGPPPAQRRVELAIPAPPSSRASGASRVSRVSGSVAELSVAELSARAESLFDRGEVGEAIEVARRAAAADPEQPTAWAVLASLHASAGHEAQARARFVACVAHTRAREVEACNALRDGSPAR